MFWQKQFDDFAARLQHDGIPIGIRLWNGLEAKGAGDPKVKVTVPAVAALTHLLKPTLDSLGQAYVEGKIEVEGRVRDIIDVATRLTEQGSQGQFWRRPKSLLFRHTHKVDAEAIAYHYDVSNEFYQQWLDERMVYSCGYFHTPEDTLEAAQLQKIDHILTKIRVRPGDRLLDIGCGWGALMMRAAEKFGAKTVGITLSQNQYELAKERIAAAGLQDRCEVRIQDYRDVTGTFDRITSVGMFEHVGLKNLHDYFVKVRSLLADDGVVMNHGITSTDPESSESPFGGGNFIGNYVFPHGELPHISLALKEMCEAGLEPVDIENLRRHYALTLDHWTERYEAAGERLRTMVGDKRYRIWRVYLAGCAYGFAHNWVALHQIVAVKGGADVLPLTRDYMYRS
ncbi:MAG: class I SAM-dependent methyltransferase [Burkholderiaceae bacterium]